MLPSELVSKPVNEWTVDDLNLIVERQSEESQFLEFKEYMPVKNQGSGWNFNGILHANQRDGLAKEIVAFANAYGGHLIVGIKETEEKPSRAEKLGDLNDNVAELAERLRSALNSIIDPPINGLRIQPIPKTEKGQGFLAIHVPQSIHAPHGFGNPPLAYVRRADRSEPMSMRDLQNVFWEARTRRERINGELESQRLNIVGQTPLIGRVRIGFFAVSKNICTITNLRSLATIENPNRWNGIYRARNGAIAVRTPDEISGSWTSNHAGVSGQYSESRRTGSWEVDDSGVVSSIFDMEGAKSAATNSHGKNLFEHHAIWYLNSLKVFMDFLKLVSMETNPKCDEWIVKIVVLSSPYEEIFFKINDWGESVNMKPSQVIEVRPMEINFSDPCDDYIFMETKFWSAFGTPEEYREVVFVRKT